jgi:hypothetical protein
MKANSTFCYKCVTFISVIAVHKYNTYVTAQILLMFAQGLFYRCWDSITTRKNCVTDHNRSPLP